MSRDHIHSLICSLDRFTCVIGPSPETDSLTRYNIAHQLIRFLRFYLARIEIKEANEKVFGAVLQEYEIALMRYVHEKLHNTVLPRISEAYTPEQYPHSYQ